MCSNSTVGFIIIIIRNITTLVLTTLNHLKRKEIDAIDTI